jgi:MoaA/NifB/PqqE/SkfB family radical SAM enzyme
MQIETLGFHIEPTNICTLKCSGCARTRFIEQWPQHWKNHNIDADQLLAFLDIDLRDKHIDFTGNYGDSIYHPDFINLVSVFKQKGCRISIGTNGSYKTAEWWNSLCDQLDATDVVKFSIDGMPNNFTQYRHNADWPSIELGIKICVARKIPTVWKYIPFAFNEGSIDSARELSQQLGIQRFDVKLSDRFDEKTQHLIPSTSLIGNRLHAQNAVKQGHAQAVNPECYAGKSYFISADGFFVPCCYMADHRFYYKNQFGKEKKLYDIRTTTFTKIMNQSSVVEFYQTIPTNPSAVCQFSCPAVD